MRLACPPPGGGGHGDWVRPPLSACPSPKPARFDKSSLRTNAAATPRPWGVSPPAHAHPPSALWDRAQDILSGPHSGTTKRAWYRCECGQQESTASVQSGIGNYYGVYLKISGPAQNPHFAPAYLFSLVCPPLGYPAFLINNSQAQALEAEAGRDLESEIMCMSKGPQTFQSQVFPGVIIDLDPHEGVGSENG